MAFSLLTGESDTRLRLGDWSRCYYGEDWCLLRFLHFSVLYTVYTLLLRDQGSRKPFPPGQCTRVSNYSFATKTLSNSGNIRVQ